jgi:hypothetical protein
MRAPNLLSWLASVFASAWAGSAALGLQWLKHDQSSEIDWRFVLLIAAAALVSTAIAAVLVPVTRSGGAVTSMGTALLSSVVFSGLAAIAFPVLLGVSKYWPSFQAGDVVMASTIGTMAFWVAFVISGPSGAVGAAVFDLALDAACRWARWASL